MIRIGLILVFILCIVSIHAQTHSLKRNLVGIQFNPLANGSFAHEVKLNAFNLSYISFNRVLPYTFKFNLCNSYNRFSGTELSYDIKYIYFKPGLILWRSENSRNFFSVNQCIAYTHHDFYMVLYDNLGTSIEINKNASQFVAGTEIEYGYLIKIFSFIQGNIGAAIGYNYFHPDLISKYTNYSFNKYTPGNGDGNRFYLNLNVSVYVALR